MSRLLFTALPFLSLSAGCATGGNYQASQTTETESYTPSISDVPPSFYDYDPTLRYWYTAPYWNPDRDD